MVLKVIQLIFIYLATATGALAGEAMDPCRGYSGLAACITGENVLLRRTAGNRINVMAVAEGQP